MKDAELHFILERGICAPSADNLQPWKFRILKGSSGPGVEIWIDDSRSKNFCDVDYLAPYVSAGAVIENMSIAAQHLGYQIQAAYFPEKSNPLLAAAIRFEASRSKGHSLGEWILLRATNRTFYDARRKITDALYKDAAALVKKTRNFNLIWIKNDSRPYERLKTIIGLADQIRFENERLHRELFGVLRFDSRAVEACQDGLDLRSLEAGPGSSLFFKFIASWQRLRFMNHLGLSRLMNLYARQQMDSSQAAGLVVAYGQTPEDYIRGGELTERLWLSLAAQNIALQPMEALPIFIIYQQRKGAGDFSPQHQKTLEQLKREFFDIFKINDQNALILLFRTGYPKRLPTVRSLRRPLQSFLMENST